MPAIAIAMKKRKPVLLVDDSTNSQTAVDLLKSKNIEYVEYHIKNFEESCCGDLPTTRAPSVFAPEGIFKGLEGVQEFASLERKPSDAEEAESESAYW